MIKRFFSCTMPQIQNNLIKCIFLLRSYTASDTFHCLSGFRRDDLIGRTCHVIWTRENHWTYNITNNTDH